jgi:hypothetical protein
MAKTGKMLHTKAYGGTTIHGIALDIRLFGRIGRRHHIDDWVCDDRRKHET